MKKLLLLLLLIPNLVLADYDPSKSFDPSKPYKVLAPEGSDPKNVTRIELQCAEAAGYSKNEYSAKKIEVSCLKKFGLIVYQENSDIFDEPYSELILLIFVILLFIGYKKIKDKRLLNEATAAVKLSRSLTESGKDRTDQDMIPGGSGEFGLDPKNPIPTNNVQGSRLYLSKLNTIKGAKVTYERCGSTTTDNLPNVTDIYNIFSKGELYATIYICPYHKKNSTLAPKGLVLKK